MNRTPAAAALLGALLLSMVGAAPDAQSVSALVLGTSPPGAVDQCGGSGGSETILPLNLGSAAPQYVATFDGVVTSMTYSAASAPVGMQVRAVFVKPASGGDYAVTAKSPQFPMVAGKVTSYPLQVGVHTGDYLALNFKGGGEDDTVGCWFTNAGSSVVMSSSDVDSTSVLHPNLGPITNVVPDISVVLEPDADHDGYGDVSQDQCPTSATSHEACPTDRIAPDTTITGQPKKKTRKHTVTIRFTSPDSTATFQCALDKGPFLACTSPTKVKKSKGKHVLMVRAVDPAGNVDATPAVVRWKVLPAR